MTLKLPGMALCCTRCPVRHQHFYVPRRSLSSIAQTFRGTPCCILRRQFLRSYRMVGFPDSLPGAWYVSESFLHQHLPDPFPKLRLLTMPLRLTELLNQLIDSLVERVHDLSPCIG